MLKRILLVFGICICFGLKAQNLIQNGSFEEYYPCPEWQGGFPINYAKYWYSPNKNTPDYFSTCVTDPDISVPSNFLGYQIPKDGDGYCGGQVFGLGDPNREYLTNRLLSPLLKDTFYCLKFYISLSGKNTYKTAIDRIQIYFSSDSSWYDTFFMLPVNPQIESEPGYFLEDTINWMEISIPYTALGGERYMTIGNFRENIDTDTIKLTTNGGNKAYYYFDEFSLIQCNPPPPPLPITSNQITIYPNPAIDYATIQYEFLPVVLNPIVELFDNLGRVVFKSEINSIGTLQILAYSLNSGIYQIRVIDGKQIIWTSKLAVQH